ncbi:MAG: mechanosensitive ion channel domain-containing protein [bacterium]
MKNHLVKIFHGFLAIAAVFLWFLPVASVAQSTNDVDPDPASRQINVAPVKVDGEIIFFIRGISSYTAQQRAEAISTRIIDAAADYDVPVDSVQIISGTDRIKIFAGPHFIMNIYQADATREGIQQAVLAEMIHHKLVITIEKYRHERSRPVLIKKIFYATGALVLLLLIMFGLLRLIRWVNRLIQSRIKSKIESMETKSFHLIQSGQLWKAFHLLFHVLRIVIIVLIIAVFFQFILSLFPWTNSIAVYTLNLFLEPVLTIFRGFVSFLPSLAFLIVIYVVTRYLLKLIKMLFTGVQTGEITLSSFKPEWAMPTFRIVRVFIIVFAVIIAYPYIPGSETSAFKGVSVFMGILLSLGSSSLIGNVIAGYSMTYRGAYKIGDWILVNGNIGVVEEQKLLVTRLRSLKNEEIVIPNSLLLNSLILNYSTKSQGQGLILHTTVGIGYETPWRQVEAMLKLAAARTVGLKKDPPPFVLQESLGDFAITYQLNVFCDNPSRMKEYYTLLHQNILDVFNENNVQIMTPAYERDPAEPKVVPPDQWNTPLTKEK